MNKNQFMSIFLLLLAIILALGIGMVLNANAKSNTVSGNTGWNTVAVEPFLSDDDVAELQSRHKQTLYQYMTLLYTNEPAQNLYTKYILPVYANVPTVKPWYTKFQTNHLLGSIADINLMTIQPVDNPDFYYPDQPSMQKVHGITDGPTAIDYLTRLYTCLARHDENQLKHNSIQENYETKMPYSQLMEMMYVSTFVPNALENIYIMSYNEAIHKYPELFQNYKDYIEFIKMYTSAEQMAMATRDLMDEGGNAVMPTNFVKPGKVETPVIQGFMASVLYMYADPKYVQGLQPAYINFYRSLVYFIGKFAIKPQEPDSLDVLVTPVPTTLRPTTLAPTTQAPTTPVPTTPKPIPDYVVELTSGVEQGLPVGFPTTNVYVKLYMVGGGGGGGGGASGKYNRNDPDVAGSGGGSGSSGTVVITNPVSYTGPIIYTIGKGGAGGTGAPPTGGDNTGNAGSDGDPGFHTTAIIGGRNYAAVPGNGGTGGGRTGGDGGDVGVGAAIPKPNSYDNAATLDSVAGIDGIRGVKRNGAEGAKGGDPALNKLSTKYFDFSVPRTRLGNQTITIPNALNSGWTNNNAQNTTVNEIVVYNGGRFCYYNTGLTSFKNYKIEFSVYLTGGCPNVAFGCNSNGTGNMLRFEQRGRRNKSGFAKVSDWWHWDAPSSSSESWQQNTWLTMRIEIDENGMCKAFKNGNAINSSADYQISDVGGYIGIIGDNGGGSGIYVKNIQISQIDSSSASTIYFGSGGAGGKGGKAGSGGGTDGKVGGKGVDGYICAVFMHRPNGIRGSDYKWFAKNDNVSWQTFSPDY